MILKLQLLLVVAAAVSAVGALNWGELESEFKDEFQLWKKMFKKEYNSAEEEITRFAVWLNNLRIVNQHNLETSLGLHSFTLAQNEYSDMSSSEVQRVMNGYKGKTPRNNTGTFKLLTNPQLPEEVDWRKEPGYVSPVKNQGQCGSCWSFSTTGALEGQHFKKTGEQVDLSEQQLVDCSRSYGNNGCEGGLMDYAFQYIKDNQGLDTEQGYPYEGEDDQCRFKKSDVGATDNGFVDVTSESEEALKQAVANIGPTSVAIDASHPSFQMYSRGVYDEPECNQEQLDHGVLVVGYGTSEEGKDFWIVKNSWGESWGENGYIRMSRNKDNQCGIASVASYPTV